MRCLHVEKSYRSNDVIRNENYYHTYMLETNQTKRKRTYTVSYICFLWLYVSKPNLEGHWRYYLTLYKGEKLI